jgi:nicotinate-nucleotide adenylyltransferase
MTPHDAEPTRTPIARWPAPDSAKVVALMGGTFDPVHRGHVELGLKARDAVGAEWLVFMPAARNPLKQSGPMLSDRARVELLALACDGLERVGVSTLELEEAGNAAAPSYTVDTLRTLAVTVPNTKLRLVIGADSARSFHLWRSSQEIIALAEPAVLLRAPDETPNALLAGMASHWSAHDLEAWRSRVVTTALINVSATRLRELLHAKAWDNPELHAALHPKVLERLRQT